MEGRTNDVCNLDLDEASDEDEAEGERGERLAGPGPGGRAGRRRVLAPGVWGSGGGLATDRP